CVQGVIYW
nr:immunoglobulin heavy chain junction region [Macaca mulatta]